jgi:alpha-tubulin suppressor-like RCC1 family protein
MKKIKVVDLESGQKFDVVIDEKGKIVEWKKEDDANEDEESL